MNMQLWSKKISKFQKKLFWDTLVTTAMHQDDNEDEYEDDLWDDHGEGSCAVRALAGWEGADAKSECNQTLQ